MTTTERDADLHRQLAELQADTWRAIQKMSRAGLRQLADRPRVPDEGIVWSNPKKGLFQYGNNRVYSVANSYIAPRNYHAPAIEGLTDVRLESVRTTQDIVRYRLGDRDVFRRPEFPVDRGVYVSLRKDPGNEEAFQNGWRYGVNFGMSSRGYAEPISMFEHRPAVHLAAAALVGQAVNQAQLTDIPLGEAVSLYASWQELDPRTPVPPSGEHIWSIYDQRTY